MLPGRASVAAEVPPAQAPIAREPQAEENPVTRVKLAIAFVLALPPAAFAHVTLEEGEAPAAAIYEGTFSVGHGCDGSPTVAIRVQIPEGVVDVEAEPVPGWELETRTVTYAQPVQVLGQPYSEGIAEIAWRGGPLPDGTDQRFPFRALLPEAEPGTVIYFPVVQECVEGVSRWIETGADGGQGGHGDHGSPAPSVTIIGNEASNR